MDDDDDGASSGSVDAFDAYFQKNWLTSVQLGRSLMGKNLNADGSDAEAAYESNDSTGNAYDSNDSDDFTSGGGLQGVSSGGGPQHLDYLGKSTNVVD